MTDRTGKVLFLCGTDVNNNSLVNAYVINADGSLTPYATNPRPAAPPFSPLHMAIAAISEPRTSLFAGTTSSPLPGGVLRFRGMKRKGNTPSHYDNLPRRDAC